MSEEIGSPSNGGEYKFSVGDFIVEQTWYSRFAGKGLRRLMSVSESSSVFLCVFSLQINNDKTLVFTKNALPKNASPNK